MTAGKLITALMNDEGRVFPFTADIETSLTERLAIHKQLAAIGTICPFVFHRKGERIVHFRAAWKNACKAAGAPAHWCMTCAGLPSGRSSARACRDRSPGRWSGTRQNRSIVDTRSSMQRCSGNRRRARTRGWLFLRQHHRRPPLLRSVKAIDSAAASRGESGYPTPAWREFDAQCGVYATTHLDQRRRSSACAGFVRRISSLGGSTSIGCPTSPQETL